jgi:hypothetical protein
MLKEWYIDVFKELNHPLRGVGGILSLIYATEVFGVQQFVRQWASIEVKQSQLEYEA